MVRIKTLLNLLSGAVALLGMAPVINALDRPLAIVGPVAIIFGLWCDHRNRYYLTPWLATLVGLASVAFYGMQLTREDVATPVVNALMLLLVIRLVSAKQGRDYLQIFVLALFMLAGSTLISLEFGYLTYLVLLVFSITIGLVMLTAYVSDSELTLRWQQAGKLLRISTLLPVFSLLLMVLFFFVLPRTRHPLWNFLNPRSAAQVGLSEKVQPGSFSRISAIKALAFRVEAAEMAPEDLYWRALVLNWPEGDQWVRKTPPKQGATHLLGGRPSRLIFYTEPRNDRYLVTLDRPNLLTGVRYNMASDQTYLSRSRIDRRMRYEAMVQVGASQRITGMVNESFYLELPSKISDRIRQVADRIRVQNKTVEGRSAALADFFRTQQLSYAEDDLPTGEDVIGQFLFEKKRGYCEFFASAYVTLARLSGIPARLVGGYLGGDYNPFGGYYLVTEDRAHVWADILNEERDWTRVDPSTWAVNAESMVGGVQRRELNQLQQLIDSLNYYWVQAVVVFDFDQQLEFLRDAKKNLGQLQKPDIAGPQLARSLLLVVSALGLYLGWRWRRQSVESRIMARFRSKVRKKYGETSFPASCGLQELAERLGDERCREFARVYQSAVFSDRPLSAEELKRLRELLQEL